MKKLEIARIFNEIADMLELNGDNPFRIRAYRKAALNIESLSEDLEEVARQNKLEDIPGIGADLALKIKKYLETGRVEAYEKIKKETPQVLLEMVSIPGIGPKTAKHLFDALKIKTIDDLEKKVKQHKIIELPGMKERTEENILKGIEFLKRKTGKMLLSEALTVSGEVISELKKLKEVKDVSAAGSLRRMKETVRDIDILVISTKPSKVMDTFVSLPQVKQVLAHGPTKSSVLTGDDIQVDVRVMDKDAFGAALVYFTGSKAHNIHLRKIGIEKGLKVNEYGIFKVKTGKKIAGKTESEVYESLGMPYILPELREDRGEVEAAVNDKLPELVGPKDIRGDFHVHSDWSDGYYTIEEIVDEAKKKGYEYIVITDHSKSLKIAGGLSNKERIEQIEIIRKLNKKIKGFELLAGAEVDILDDGTLDYADDILKELDFVIAAIHSGFKQSKEKLTNRIVTAMKNKHVHMLAHPTGRLLGVRDAYEIDMEEILKSARQTGTFIEINSYPERLDLTDINCRRAKALGVKLAITTDSHSLEQFNNMRYGISVAQRGWLGKEDILNSYSWSNIRKMLKK